jgi:hypothetical protein
MKDFVRILVLLAVCSVGGAALSYSKAVANGWAFDWFSLVYAIPFGMVIGGAVLWPFLAWQDHVTRRPAGTGNHAEPGAAPDPAGM